MHSEQHGDRDRNHTFDALIHIEALQNFLDRTRVLHETYQFEQAQNFYHFVHSWELEHLAEASTPIRINLNILKWYARH